MVKKEIIARCRKKILCRWKNKLRDKECKCNMLQRQTENTRKALWDGLQDPDGEWLYLIGCAESKIGKLRKDIEKTKIYFKNNNLQW